MCGYSLSLANQVYGEGFFDLARVTDPAGALKQEEIYKLADFLEQLEQRIAPVALTVYITDQGQANAFTQHAHWILNHGKVNHASFGKRSINKAIEESTSRILKVDIGGQEEQDQSAAQYEGSRDIFSKLFSSIKEYFRKPAVHVESQWMLMLVVDVQLRAACFTWGYKLDPYMDHKLLEEAIKDKRLKFRESSLLPSIKAVLKKTVSSLASHAIDVNAKLKKTQQPKHIPTVIPEPSIRKPRDFSQLIRNAEMSEQGMKNTMASPEKARAASSKKNTQRKRKFFMIHALALGLLAHSADTTPTAPPLIGSAASEKYAPSWTEDDAAQLADKGQAELYKQSLPTGAKPPTSAPSAVQAQEDLQAHEIIALTRHSHKLLLDPRGLLTKQERNELTDRLERLQAETPYTIYLCIFHAEQQMTSDLDPENLLGFIGKSGEFSLMLQYRVGKAQSLSLGYHSQIKLGENTIADIDSQLQHCILNQSGHTATLLAALTVLQDELEEPSRYWDSDMMYGSELLPKIDIPWEDKSAIEKRKKFSFKDFILNTELGAEGWVTLSFIICTAVYLLGRIWRRRRVQLYDTEVDFRLSSPIGAAVSRPIRYMEGKTIPKSSSPAMGPQRH